MYLEIIVSVLLLAITEGQDHSREGKWFSPPRTKTLFVREKLLVTETVPSSCAAIHLSLPPCRHVRQLNIKPNPTEKIEITTSPGLLLRMPDNSPGGLVYGPRFIFSSNGYLSNQERQDNEPKPLSWMEYLGLNDVTVTKTAVHSVTAKYYDPNTVVTFNLRGCRPSKLPFNLPLCNNNSTTNATINSLSKELHYVP